MLYCFLQSNQWNEPKNFRLMGKSLLYMAKLRHCNENIVLDTNIVNGEPASWLWFGNYPTHHRTHLEYHFKYYLPASKHFIICLTKFSFLSLISKYIPVWIQPMFFCLFAFLPFTNLHKNILLTSQKRLLILSQNDLCKLDWLNCHFPSFILW